jgi:hypothetical protein
VGGLTALFALFPIFHLIFGLVMVLAPHTMEADGEQPPVFIGWFFVIFAGVLIALGLIIATLVVTAGRYLARQKHYLFCLVVAGLECMLMPYGTVLGVFTIIVLMRESVKELFSANQSVERTA